jgi:antitoxin PrlF
MVKSDLKSSCCTTEGKSTNCCRIESLASVDERGQMVLPKELRDRADIKAGDKLAVISWEKDGAVCCLTMIKAEYLAEKVKDFLGPVMGDILGYKDVGKGEGK